MIKIFFDQTRPDLIFALAAIMGNAKGDHVVMMPLDLEEKSENLLEEACGQQQKYAAENYAECLTPNGLPDRLFLLNIGPDSTDHKGFMQFLLDHEDEIVLWTDSHQGWTQEEINFDNSRKNIIRLNGRSCLQTLISLGYQAPVWWQETEAAMLAAVASDIAKNNDAIRYHGAFWMKRIMSHNSGENNMLDVFREAVTELVDGVASEEIDRLNNLVQDMIRETRQAKSQLSSNTVWFQEARQHDRPVGYLRLDDAPEYLDTKDIMAYGRQQYPWLFVFAYNMKGREILQAESDMLDMQQILDYYYSLTKDEDALLRCLNTEVVKFKKGDK
jgi:hypothetical protein